MLRFKVVSILYFLSLLILVFLCVYHNLSLLFLLIPCVCYVLALFYGSFFVDSHFYLPAICSAKNKSKQIALSFDDGPVQNFTPRILDILQQEQVPAAFFCVGKNFSGNEDLIKRMHAEGHIIGNHTFTHDTWFDLKFSRRMRPDLEQMSTELYRLLNLKPRFFRPPYGITTPVMTPLIKTLELITIGWSIRSLDVVTKDEKKLLARISRRLHPGAIILLHDTCEITVNILPQLICECKKSGYEFIRLDQLIQQDAYAT